MAKRARFDASALSSFLESGWLLALDRETIALGWGDWRVASKTSPSPGALFAPDFYISDQHSWVETVHWDCIEWSRFASLVLTAEKAKVNDQIDPQKKLERTGNFEKFQWVEPQKTEFERVWREIQAGFHDRGLIKAVPIISAHAQAEMSSARRAQIFSTFGRIPRHLYPYGFWNQREGMVGATPEILFSRQGSGEAVETIALAGTRRKTSPEDAILLLRDAKERFEHQIVVRDLIERLSVLGDVAHGDVEVLELPMLYHLKTRLRMSPRNLPEFNGLVDLLHPTPALGVAPRELGFAEMRRWDNPDVRRRFGAPFGVVLEEGRFHCVVAIRNLQWRDDSLLLASGCGIVGESVFEREWQELNLKRESVKRLLEI